MNMASDEREAEFYSTLMPMLKKVILMCLGDILICTYDSIAGVGKTGVWLRADFQNGSRVLKKVF